MTKFAPLSLLVVAGGSPSVPRTFLWQAQDMLALREQALEHGAVEEAVRSLQLRADAWLGMGPWTVTSKDKDAVPDGADIHDYVSLNKYWWPCTATPGVMVSTSDASDPTCDAGVLHTGTTPVCCPLSCETCAGTGCSADADNCCLSNILAANQSCNDHEAPCVVDTDSCNAETGLPYKQWDGLVNPESEKYDHDALENMTAAVMDLSLAAFYLDNSTYAKHASKVLETWFLNATTKMNPNLQWGHWTPGWCDQRREGACQGGANGGFIDSHWNPELLDATALLSFSHPQAWRSTDQEALLSWFGDFLNWTNTSLFGQKERAETNNHGVWFDVQALALALHVGDKNVAMSIAETAGPNRLAVQATSQGALPAEEARTKAFSYNNFALNGLLHLASLIESCRESGGLCEGASSLFEFKADSGATLLGVVEHQLPWVLKPDSFPFEQVVPFFYPDCTENMVDECLSSYFWPLRRASLSYENANFESAIATISGLDYQAHWANLVLPKLAPQSLLV